jgi:hypothetical protein
MENIMRTQIKQKRYTLARRELMALAHTHGFMIECAEGELWITAEGGAGDIILHAGECLQLENHPKVVISALRPSVFTAAPCSSETPLREIAARCAGLIADRIARWRHPPLASYSATRIY